MITRFRSISKVCLALLPSLVLTLVAGHVPPLDGPQTAFAQQFSPYYYTMVRQHGRVDGNVPEGAVIFVGDSMIQGLAVAAVAERSVNYGISGDTTAGVLKRLGIYKSLQRARAIVMLVGVNDLGLGDGEALIENYRKILETLPKGAEVIVCAILPIDETILQLPSGNSRIRSINVRLEALCREDENISFIDPGRDLADQAGNLKKSLHVGDGIHLSRAGYSILINDLSAILNDSH